MQVLLAQIEKEWCSFRRDRLGMALAILLPLATLLLFGYGVRLTAENIPVAIKDCDRTANSKKLKEEFQSTGLIVSKMVSDDHSVDSDLVNNDVKAALVIPKGFSERIAAGDAAQFEMLIDGSDVSSAETIAALTQVASFKLEHQILPPDIHSLFVIPDVKMMFNQNAEEAPFVVSGVFAIVLWMYPALLAAVAIARELEGKTIIQVYSSALTSLQLLVGKGMVYFGIGVMVALAMMIISHFLFGLTLVANPLVLTCATLAYVAAAVSFGLFVGVATKEENMAVQATATGGFFPALLLSGFVYPISNIPFPLSLVSLFVPARYYIDICRDSFMRGADWHEMGWRILLLIGFMILLFSAAWFSVRKMRLEDH